jgi:hypothetical protein
VRPAIITAIKDRWTPRSVDSMGDQLAGSTPIDAAPQPVVVENPSESLYPQRTYEAESFQAA